MCTTGEKQSFAWKKNEINFGFGLLCDWIARKKSKDSSLFITGNPSLVASIPVIIELVDISACLVHSVVYLWMEV